jgi:hypothetical protein
LAAFAILIAYGVAIGHSSDPRAAKRSHHAARINQSHLDRLDRLELEDR